MKKEDDKVEKLFSEKGQKQFGARNEIQQFLLPAVWERENKEVYLRIFEGLENTSSEERAVH